MFCLQRYSDFNVIITVSHRLRHAIHGLDLPLCTHFEERERRCVNIRGEESGRKNTKIKHSKEKKMHFSEEGKRPITRVSRANI